MVWIWHYWRLLSAIYKTDTSDGVGVISAVIKPPACFYRFRFCEGDRKVVRTGALFLSLMHVLKSKISTLHWLMRCLSRRTHRSQSTRRSYCRRAVTECYSGTSFFRFFLLPLHRDSKTTNDLQGAKANNLTSFCSFSQLATDSAVAGRRKKRKKLVPL